ncbi:NAD(P)H-binding protein [Streptomyces sp. RFCAC02]|uniref:SDR family oxidoreductase n=1 Tax=Streptomyces sp. RFCAC02 TaxID=2499143 RepID=UPI00101F6FA6|nr:NAD(P)H-binding protein [Streptomyces sp. RFCAC02]
MILVTGATGSVGSDLIGELTEACEGVHALSRRPGALTRLPATAEAVTGDPTRPATLAAALDGVDGVFLLPWFAEVPGLLARARAVGVRHVVLLSSHAAAAPRPASEFARRVAGAERAVRACGLPWTLLRARPLMTNTLRWLPQLRRGDVVRVPFPDVAAAVVDPSDVAAVAARTLLVDGHAGRTYEITGPEALFPRDLVATLGTVLGRELRCEPLPEPHPPLEPGEAHPADGDASAVLPAVETVTGAPPQNFERWAQRHISLFL